MEVEGIRRSSINGARTRLWIPRLWHTYVIVMERQGSYWPRSGREAWTT
jgi:hypothetical protein